MSLAHQPSMWDVAEEAALTPLTGRVTRHQLSRGAWVDHLPGWVEGSDVILDVLLGDIGWRADRRQMYEREVAVPRLLRWYGGEETLPHPTLIEARRDLDHHYMPELGEPFVTAGMCLYRDGRDSVAWHGDRIGRSRTEDTMVAIVSFGSPRPQHQPPGLAERDDRNHRVLGRAAADAVAVPGDAVAAVAVVAEA
jgi:alkylated DNA repair dioxygenase AlkB